MKRLVVLAFACLCAALVLLDEPDPELAARCLVRWKATDGDEAETAIYES